MLDTSATSCMAFLSNQVLASRLLARLRFLSVQTFSTCEIFSKELRSLGQRRPILPDEKQYWTLFKDPVLR